MQSVCSGHSCSNWPKKNRKYISNATRGFLEFNAFCFCKFDLCREIAVKLQVVRRTSGTCWEIDANNSTIIKAGIEGEGVTNPFTVCIHIKADISACLRSSKRIEFLSAGCAAFVV